MSTLTDHIARRRTFAIIAHPDAGKTTLTEKLLLQGGAINMAGAVKARGEQRRARSDWMKVERERGISVTSAVMSFDYDGKSFNLLDTPGHEDFSEDTYRTLTAVDSAVMVLDAAKGIESQTLKLFEVCRLRDIPIISFINKMDREAQDPLILLDEIEQKLALDVTPASWPIGMGRNFKGVYDLLHDRLILNESGAKGKQGGETLRCENVQDPQIDAAIGAVLAAELREGVEMARALCPPFDHEAYLAGHLTPVYFGSALNQFGVRELLHGLAAYAPSPRPQPALERQVNPDEPRASAFVFKIQANMDPKHRDRIAFIRLVSGQFKKGIKLRHPRSGKTLAVYNAVQFLAQDRDLAEEAWPGDILGIPNHGNLRIGDTLIEGNETITFTGVPSFAPEYLQRARPADPLKAKHLGRALEQLAEEGAARVFKPDYEANWIVGVVGALQFDVLADRIRTEYEVDVHFEPVAIYTARWISSADPAKLKAFMENNRSAMAQDHDNTPVFLPRNAWHLQTSQDDWPEITFSATKEQA